MADFWIRSKNYLQIGIYTGHFNPDYDCVTMPDDLDGHMCEQTLDNTEVRYISGYINFMFQV